MGLDISLIKIVKEPFDQLNWLSSEESPELLEMYKNKLTERVYEDGDREKAYWYDELSYQRKGVSKSFYDNYEHNEFLFEERELYILFDHISLEYRESFKNEFLKKFKEGDNFIMMEY